MRQGYSFRYSWIRSGLVLLALAACGHEAPRENPLDPALQPATAYDHRVVVANTGGFEALSAVASLVAYSVGPVDLLPIVADAATGALHLRWTQYAGPGLRSYRVLRRPVGTVGSQIVHTTASVGDAAFADTSALHQQAYLYTVEVSAGDLSLETRPVEARLDLTPVHLYPPRFHSAAATAALQWSSYPGPAFERYVVVRRSPDGHPLEVATLTARDDTTMVEGNLHGATSYTYDVAVLTARGERLESNPVVGGFHMLEGEWALEYEPGTNVRLYRPAGAILAAVISEPRRSRMVYYDGLGAPLSEVDLWSGSVGAGLLSTAVAWLPGQPEPSAVALATEDGIAVADLNPGHTFARKTIATLVVDAPGSLFESAVTHVSLELSGRLSGTEGPLLNQSQFGGVRVVADGGVALVDDFSDPLVSASQWTFIRDRYLESAGRLSGYGTMAIRDSLAVRSSLVGEATAWPHGGNLHAVRFVIPAGGTTWAVTLRLDDATTTAELSLVSAPAGGVVSVGPTEVRYAPGVPLDLVLEVTGSQVADYVRSTFTTLTGEVSSPPSLAAVGFADALA